MQDEGRFPLQVSQFSVGCCRAGAVSGTGTGAGARAGGVSWPLQVTAMASGQNACCTPWQAEAALLGSGSKGDSSLMLEEAPPSPSEHLLLLPFLPDIVVAVWISALSRKKTLAAGSHFLLRQLGNVSEKMTGGRCSHHIPLLHCPLQSPSLSSILTAGAGSSPWRDEVLGWCRTCPWLSVASAESTRWVSGRAGDGAGLCACSQRGGAGALGHGWAGSTHGAGL